MLYGADIVPEYFDAGHVLFNDTGAGITFRQANALDENALKEWHGQFPIITSNYVQHVFGVEEQEKYATVILKLLSGGPNDLFFGMVIRNSVIILISYLSIQVLTWIYYEAVRAERSSRREGRSYMGARGFTATRRRVSRSSGSAWRPSLGGRRRWRRGLMKPSCTNCQRKQRLGGLSRCVTSCMRSGLNNYIGTVQYIESGARPASLKTPLQISFIRKAFHTCVDQPMQHGLELRRAMSTSSHD